MKKILSLLLLLVSFASYGQFTNYTNINGRYKWIAGKFDSTFTLPSGTTPSLRTGGGTGPGAMFYRTTDSTIYQYTGTQWIKLRGSISPSDTAGLWMTNVYRKPGSDSVFYVKGGTHTFAFRDSIGIGGGGGGGKIYYFNGGVSMGTFGGLPMYELGDTANTGAAANFTKSTTGAIANFITDPNKPGLLQIPAGTWTIDAWVSETGGGANHAQIWAVLEKWDGSTITTIATSPIEEITNGSTIDLYTWSLSVPTTSITVTDRIIIQFYITNTNGKTVTLYTQNGYVGEVHTTFTTGLGSLNGLTAASQYFATGTSGTDFAISSSTATHTFNLPTASATNRGALSSADWTTFNGKVGGSGTTNYVSKFTASGTIGNSQIFDNGTNVGIGNISPSAKLDVTAANGEIRSTGTAASYTQYNAFITSGVNMRIGAYATNNGYLGTTTNHPFIIETNNTERARFTATGDLGIGTASPTTKITMFGQNPTFRVQGDGVSYYGGIDFWSSVSGTNRKNGSIEQYDANGLYIGAGTGMRLTFTVNNGTEGMRLTSSGRLLIGTTTESTYILDANGTVRVQGTELRLDNATTGVINLYSATPVIQFAAGTGDGYSIGRTSTNMNIKSNGAILMYIGANQSYQFDATNGHLFKSGIAGSTTWARLTTGGNFMVGTSTDEASAVLQATSTTKGFLPPRMTGAQAEAIATPATGLMVYANNGNGTTITSTGWWGYNGTTWVKLN